MLTAFAAVGQGGSLDDLWREAGYVLISIVALFSPMAIVVQVLLGLSIVAAGLATQGAGLAALPLVPMLAGVVVTTELLAVTARLDAPTQRDPRPDLARALITAVLAGGVFATVLLAAALPGPRGLVAVVLSAAACLSLAIVLVRGVRTG